MEKHLIWYGENVWLEKGDSLVNFFRILKGFKVSAQGEENRSPEILSEIYVRAESPKDYGLQKTLWQGSVTLSGFM